MLVVLNVVYVLIAIAMIALILMQRGAGASAGSGFGAGASATVFGATGAGNFLSKATKWLAIVFFGISMFMAWHATNSSAPSAQQADLGLMAEVPAAQADDASQVVPAAPTRQAPVQQAPVQQAVPAAPAQDVPAADVPTATDESAPADAAEQVPEPAPGN